MRLRKTFSFVSILLGFLIAIWGRFTLLAGVPFYLIGVFLCLTSDWKLWLKLTLTIFPILLWLPFMLGFWYMKNKTESQADTYIFPTGFHGQGIIAFGISEGDTVKIENGRRVFAFDTSGIIMTKAIDPKGLIDQEFYFKDITGRLTKIPTYEYNYDKIIDKSDSTSTKIFGWHEKGVTGEKGCNYKYFNFKVCSLAELDTIDNGFKSWKLHDKIKKKACKS